ncbi:MAG: hypothetical protein Q7N50_10755 [Armatimonadota bacterium]|nr:hypothetical protein [Armatimonadota bacterium]
MGIRWFILVEITGVAMAIVVIISQIITPMIHGTPFFPWLRHRPSAAETELAEEIEESDIADARRHARMLREARGDD